MKLLSVTSEAAQSQGWWGVKAIVSNVQTEGRFTYRSSGEAGDGPASWGRGQHIVRESGVPLLAAQKPVKRPGWWKSLLYFRYWQVEGRGEWMSVQKPTPSPPPPPHWQSETRVFIDRGRGLYAESAQSALTVSLKLVIRALTSIILDLGTVNFQFQGRFVCISLRPVLGIGAADVMWLVWSSCN